MPLCILIIWAAGTSKTANTGSCFLWTLLICPKPDFLEGQLRRVINLLLTRSFNYQGKLILITGEKTRQTLSQTIIAPIYFFKGPFVLWPKNHLLSPKRPTFPPPLSLLRCYLSPNSRPPLWVTHFFPGCLRFTPTTHINELLFFSLICLLLQGSQLRTQRIEGKLFFLPHKHLLYVKYCTTYAIS